MMNFRAKATDKQRFFNPIGTQNRSWFIALICLALVIVTTSQTSASSTSGETVTFQEMQFTLPAGTWQRSPGDPLTGQVTFTKGPEEGVGQGLSVWRVAFNPEYKSLTPEEHANLYWDYEQFEQARPENVVWTNFRRQSPTIAGKTYPFMTCEMFYPDPVNPQLISYSGFLAFFPDDFQERQSYYIFFVGNTFLVEQGRPESIEDLSWLDGIVESLTINLP